MNYIFSNKKIVVLYLRSSPENQKNGEIFKKVAKEINKFALGRIVFAQLKDNEDFKLEFEDIF